MQVMLPYQDCPLMIGLVFSLSVSFGSGEFLTLTPFFFCQAKLLQSLGIQSTLITDGTSPINLFNTANGLLGALEPPKKRSKGHKDDDSSDDE